MMLTKRAFRDSSWGLLRPVIGVAALLLIVVGSVFSASPAAAVNGTPPNPMPHNTTYKFYYPGTGCEVEMQHGNVYAAAYSKIRFTGKVKAGHSCHGFSVNASVTSWNGSQLQGATSSYVAFPSTAWRQATVYYSNIVGSRWNFAGPGTGAGLVFERSGL